MAGLNYDWGLLKLCGSAVDSVNGIGPDENGNVIITGDNIAISAANMASISTVVADLDAAKVDKDQGVANNGKVLGIGPDGMVVPVDSGGGGGGGGDFPSVLSCELDVTFPYLEISSWYNVDKLQIQVAPAGVTTFRVNDIIITANGQVLKLLNIDSGMWRGRALGENGGLANKILLIAENQYLANGLLTINRPTNTSLPVLYTNNMDPVILGQWASVLSKGNIIALTTGTPDQTFSDGVMKGFLVVESVTDVANQYSSITGFCILTAGSSGGSTGLYTLHVQKGYRVAGGREIELDQDYNVISLNETKTNTLVTDWNTVPVGSFISIYYFDEDVPGNTGDDILWIGTYVKTSNIDSTSMGCTVVSMPDAPGAIFQFNRNYTEWTLPGVGETFTAPDSVAGYISEVQVPSSGLHLPRLDDLIYDQYGSLGIVTREQDDSTLMQLRVLSTSGSSGGGDFPSVWSLSGDSTFDYGSTTPSFAVNLITLLVAPTGITTPRVGDTIITQRAQFLTILTVSNGYWAAKVSNEYRDYTTGKVLKVADSFNASKGVLDIVRERAQSSPVLYDFGQNEIPITGNNWQKALPPGTIILLSTGTVDTGFSDGTLKGFTVVRDVLLSDTVVTIRSYCVPSSTGSAVTSVNTKTGDVVLDGGDIRVDAAYSETIADALSVLTPWALFQCVLNEDPWKFGVIGSTWTAPDTSTGQFNRVIVPDSQGFEPVLNDLILDKWGSLAQVTRADGTLPVQAKVLQQASSGGAVDSVNGQTGVVNLTANDIGWTYMQQDVNVGQALEAAFDEMNNLSSAVSGKVDKEGYDSSVYGYVLAINERGEVSPESPTAGDVTSVNDLTGDVLLTGLNIRRSTDTTSAFLTDELDAKVLTDQGTHNSGKLLGIGSDGLVTPVLPTFKGTQVEWDALTADQKKGYRFASIIGPIDPDDFKVAATMTEVLQAIYPVGAIYTTTLASMPDYISSLGTWVAVEGKVLVGKSATGTFSTLGATVGNETHTLNANQMPTHGHSTNILNVGTGGTAGTAVGTNLIYSTIASSTTGGSQAHNNIQPSLVVNMWQRTA